MMVTTSLTRSEPSVTGNENPNELRLTAGTDSMTRDKAKLGVDDTLSLTGGYLSINFWERHCIFCNRLTPYSLNWEDGWFKRMWLCWQHLSSKMRRELQDFYAEIIESNTERAREERDEP